MIDLDFLDVFACTCISLISRYFILSVCITSKIVLCHYKSIALSLRRHVTSYDVKMPSHNIKMPCHDVIFSKFYSKAFVTDFCYFGEYIRWLVCFPHQGSLYLCYFLISICSVTILQFTNLCESLFNRYNL